MIESPEWASEIACPMVLQACRRVLQLLLSLPFTPSTYHVLLARAAGAKARNKTRSGRLLNTSLCLIILYLIMAALWSVPSAELVLASPRDRSLELCYVGSQNLVRGRNGRLGGFPHHWGGSLRRIRTIVKCEGVPCSVLIALRQYRVPPRY